MQPYHSNAPLLREFSRPQRYVRSHHHAHDVPWMSGARRHQQGEEISSSSYKRPDSSAVAARLLCQDEMVGVLALHRVR